MRLVGSLVIASLLASGCRENASTAVPRLQHELASTESGPRARAALDLAAYGSDAKPAVPKLITLLQDPNSGVRSAAAFALRKIDDPAGNRALDAATKRETPFAK